MPKKPLGFDPIDEAARQWGLRWTAVDQMHAVTSLMRVQQLVLAELDELLRPHGLTFARYEALVLLTFSRAGSLPLGKMGERLQDGRAVLAEITESGRAVVEAATADLVNAKFALADVPVEDLRALSALLKPVRESAGDF